MIIKVEGRYALVNLNDYLSCFSSSARDLVIKNNSTCMLTSRHFSVVGLHLMTLQHATFRVSYSFIRLDV